MQTHRPPTAISYVPPDYPEAPDVWWSEHGIDALLSPKPYVVPLAAKSAADDVPSPVGEAV